VSKTATVFSGRRQTPQACRTAPTLCLTVEPTQEDASQLCPEEHAVETGPNIEVESSIRFQSWRNGTKKSCWSKLFYFAEIAKTKFNLYKYKV
jgi:hypothetical protein